MGSRGVAVKAATVGSGVETARSRLSDAADHTPSRHGRRLPSPNDHSCRTRLSRRSRRTSSSACGLAVRRGDRQGQPSGAGGNRQARVERLQTVKSDADARRRESSVSNVANADAGGRAMPRFITIASPCSGRKDVAQSPNAVRSAWVVWATWATCSPFVAHVAQKERARIPAGPCKHWCR